MERLKLKQLEQLRLEKEQRAVEQRTALRQLIKNQQSIQIALSYAQQTLRKGTPEALTEYSPAQISRLVFDRELQLIRAQFQRLPGGQAKIEHFLVIMLRVMGFPFEKTPMYLVGLKDMFYEVALEGSNVIDFPGLFKYILGELVSIKEEQQNTEFQVQLQERKKQDYLLHDNGIKRIRYSLDSRLLLSLDDRATSLKIYDNDMKNVARFSPNKLKHGNKFPTLLDFDYSEIATRLGILLSDETLTTVHLPNLVSKPAGEFEQVASNEVVFPLPESMRRVFFMQMMNKWLTVTESGNAMYLLDMERARSQPEKVVSKVGAWTGEAQIRLALEVVPLSCVCVVAGNEISFLSESLYSHKFNKFVHIEDVEQLKYSDQRNQFYLCGREKQLTIFSIGRSGHPTRIRSFSVGRPIVDFEVFPHLDTIVIADQQHEVRLLHETTRTVYQQIAYAHIVKAKDRHLSIAKISKHEFVLYQTYQIVVSQQKIAIERGIQYSFLPYYYLDPRKQELYLSVNGQIIGFSLLSGEIRRHYNPDSSNLDQRHLSFFLAPKTPLFVLDHDSFLYEVYHREQLAEGESRTYKKKVVVEGVLGCFYDPDLQNLMIVGRNSLTQVRNDRNNNFNIISTLLIEGLAPIIRATFCPAAKVLSLLTTDQLLYQLRNYEAKIEQCLRLRFPRDAQHEEAVIGQYHFDSSYGVLVILSSKNEVYLVELVTGQQLFFSIQEHLPTKLKHHRFTALRYQILEERKGAPEHHLLLTDDTGILMQFPLTALYEQYHITPKSIPSLKSAFKETQVASALGVPVREIFLSQEHKLRQSYAEVGLMKAHEKAIALALRVRVQIPATLTVSVDGYVRLWNQRYDLLFSLKLPSLLRIAWNMGEIEEIKNRKSVQEVLDLFDQYFREAMHDQPYPAHTYHKSKRLKQRGGGGGEHGQGRLNPTDPFRIDIENKDIEELVMQQTNYSQLSPEDKSRTHRSFHSPLKAYPHPWRTKKEFRKIYQKASPPHKYKYRIPQDLLQMRSSLDMTQKVQEVPTYKEAELILPQLTHYQPEPQPEPNPPAQLQQHMEEQETFESCLYVKSLRRKKKINQLDQIDKEFKKKEMVLTARKWVPKKRKERTNSVVELKAEPSTQNEGRMDPIRSIQKIFEEHNRECMQTKKGRIIKIPKINLSKDIY